MTITALVTPDDPAALAQWFAALEEGLARYGDGEPRAVPEGGTPLVGFDLTTHQGHFMGAGHNRLLLFTDADGQTWVRAAGTWDPMPWHVDRAYKLAGQEAQHAFWGQGDVARLSLLHQLARVRRRACLTPSSSARARTGSRPRSASPRRAGRVVLLEAEDAPGGAVNRPS